MSKEVRNKCKPVVARMGFPQRKSLTQQNNTHTELFLLICL